MQEVEKQQRSKRSHLAAAQVQRDIAEVGVAAQSQQQRPTNTHTAVSRDAAMPPGGHYQQLPRT